MVQAGWYADPQGFGMRWWDGGSWTDHVSSATQHASRTAPAPSEGFATSVVPPEHSQDGTLDTSPPLPIERTSTLVDLPPNAGWTPLSTAAPTVPDTVATPYWGSDDMADHTRVRVTEHSPVPWRHIGAIALTLVLVAGAALGVWYGWTRWQDDNRSSLDLNTEQAMQQTLAGPWERTPSPGGAFSLEMPSSSPLGRRTQSTDIAGSSQPVTASITFTGDHADLTKLDMGLVAVELDLATVGETPEGVAARTGQLLQRLVAAPPGFNPDGPPRPSPSTLGPALRADADRGSSALHVWASVRGTHVIVLYAITPDSLGQAGAAALDRMVLTIR
ncbi:MAG: DUF2510 domain-containing protein [Microthrixaceae bacterium]